MTMRFGFMLFSSMIFLWIFLPVVLLLHGLLPGTKVKNFLLLAASFLFYGWGTPASAILLLLSVAANWAFGLWLAYSGERSRRVVLALAVVCNVAFLGYYKYADMFLQGLSFVFRHDFAPVGAALPAGISFFTFQAIAYLADVASKRVPAEKNPVDFALYISFFPQLVSGPIVRYDSVRSALKERRVSRNKLAYGIKRFIYGLGKKVIISNQLAATADSLFAMDFAYLPAAHLWLAVLTYAFQLYFDFSGYSDMAIGLGKMFGFDFAENFNYPYLSRSITEFWRRWHISLSSWFRDYVYIPLGGNRKGSLRTYFNLCVVFLLTGLWHGAGLCYIAWGLWHGFFMVLERLFLKKKLDSPKCRVISHIYTLFVVGIGWVFFRAGSLTRALKALVVMFTLRGGNAMPLQMFMGPGVIALLVLSVFLCGPMQAWFPKLKNALYDENRVYAAELPLCALILFFSITLLVSGSYNSFIYFNF